MPQALDTTRAFRVHARHTEVHGSRTLHEPSFEAAAVAFVEHLHELPADGGDISVVVREVETGHEHSFRVNLESGDTEPRD